MQPGYPQAKLWLDSLASLDFSADNLRRVRRSLEKRALPLDSSFCLGPLPVTRIYVLWARDCGEISIRSVDGARRMPILTNHTYRLRYLQGSGSRSEHFQSVARLAQQRGFHRFRPLTPFAGRPSTPLKPIFAVD
jgi:hypothetical protein